MPVHIEHGAGPLRAVVLSPVLPIWDEGRFFEPLVQPLIDAGYRVTIFDTLSLLLEHPHSIQAFAARWSTCLSTMGRIDLLAGSALGGAVVQAMLGDAWVANVPKVLLISAPSLADETLDTRLGSLADLGHAGNLADALTMLDQYIAPEGTSDSPISAPVAPETWRDQAARLARGFTMLLDIDVRATVDRYTGRLLHVYGERSQLVRRRNVHLRDSPLHAARGIPNCGMRPLSHDVVAVLRAMRDHLHIDVAPSQLIGGERT